MRTAQRESPLILLVESDSSTRLVEANALLDEGYDVVESESAAEAIHILDSRDDFDAMIVDIDPICAPGGLALARCAGERWCSMKMLVGSSWSEAEAESIALAANFLARPRSTGALTAAICGLLTDSAMAEPLPAN